MNSRLGIFQRLWEKSKSVIHSILRKHGGTGFCKAKKHLAGLGKLLNGKTDRLVMNKKKDRFTTATAISKRAHANLSIKISRHTIYRRCNKINLNSREASTKPYISKAKKMSRLKFATEHVI